MLWQVALHCNNKRVLKVLYELTKIPAYQSSPHVQFEHLLDFALTHLQSGDVELLNWIYENSPGDPEDSESSRSNHHQTTNEQFEELGVKLENLRVAEWVRDHDYMFPACMMGAAAASGNLELVHLLHEHGTEGCTDGAMDSAVSHEHLEIVQFLHTSRSEGCTDQAKMQVLQHGHVRTLRFLHENRKAYDYSPMAVLLGATKGELECVKFAHDHGFTGFANSVMSYTMLWGHVDVVQFLHENRPRKRYTLDALMAAERLGHHGVVDYLCRNRPVKKPVPAFREAVARGQLRLAAKLLLHSSVAWFTASERYKYPQTYPKGCNNA